MNKLMISVFAALMLTFAVTAYSDSVHENLENNLIRLHIIANSDSGEDQSIKYKIRDEILKTEGERLAAEDKNECGINIYERLPYIKATAERVLSENGFDYGAKAVYGKFEFPKKQYKNIILPCGEYYGVRVVLGNGQGKNWWCVMYPPLCMMNDTEAVMSERSKKLLKETLNDEAYEIITEGDGKIKVKFRMVEAVQYLRNKFRG